MSRLEQKVTHGNHTSYVFGIYLQAFLKVVSSPFEILKLKVNDTNLTIGLVVLIVMFNDIFVVNECFFVLVKLM